MKNQTARKLDIRVQKTFARLSDTFFELMAEMPFDSITVLRICDRAGVHRATFYKHFIDKQDFVNFCFEKKLEALELETDTLLIANDNTALIEYTEFCKRIINFVYENRSIIADMNINTNSAAFTGSLTSCISDVLEKKLNREISAGVRLISPAPMLAHYYAGAIVEILKWWATEGEQYSKEEILKFVMLRISEAQFSYKHSNLVYNQ